MKLKVILIAFITIFLTNCKSSQFDAKPPFNVSSATYNNWVGGQEGVSGIHLVFNLNSKQTIKFQKVYFNKREAILEAKEKEGKTTLIGNISTSTIGNSNLVMDVDPKKEINNEIPETNFPFDLKENEAVLSYLEKGVTKFYKVKNIKKTNTGYYQ